MRLKLLTLFLVLVSSVFTNAQDNNWNCTNNAARSWWDVQRYSLNLDIDTASGLIKGTVDVDAKVVNAVGEYLQLDLEEPLQIKSVIAIQDDMNVEMTFRKYGTSYFIKGDFKSIVTAGNFRLQIQYEGIPQKAVRPPWQGGLVMRRDANGNPWMAMTCQGTGASTWFPCKNFQGDEPDKGMQLSMVLPANLTMISNGRLQPNNERRGDGKLRWTWSVFNPINNYDISFYIGDYVHWTDTLNGLKGNLSLDYYVLRENEQKAQAQFKVVKSMLQCFETKMGPYPFYEDGYKLVDAPYLGMEHQSAVAYGNHYRMGYDGTDRSGTGVGLKFDFIIVHESGHEWFGNSITAFDKADEWIQEGFTTYSETIFAECLLGKDSAFLYQQGKRINILNDKPVQGAYNQCDEGSSDHYDKAAFMIHTIRMIMRNDSMFFAMLQSMNRTYYHKLVTGKEIEHFINTFSGKHFNKVFDQYLRNAAIPNLQVLQKNGKLFYRWTNCVAGFDMPVFASLNGKPRWITPKTQWQSMSVKASNVIPDKNFLVTYNK